MNRSKIRNKKPIYENDYIIVDPNVDNLKRGQYVVAKIEGVFVAKKFFESKGEDKCVLLMSESDRVHPPIVMDPKEFYDSALKGRVIDVIHGPESF